MSKPSEAKITGWSTGHPVWFAQTFDGARLARRHGENAKGMTLVWRGSAQFGAHWLVRFADGAEEYVAQAHLRLTAPPGESGAREKAKETKARVRKEAIDPALGVELSLLDLEA